MTNVYLALGVALLAGIMCIILEKSGLHIDKHHDAFLSGITGATAAFLLSILIMGII